MKREFQVVDYRLLLVLGKIIVEGCVCVYDWIRHVETVPKGQV